MTGFKLLNDGDLFVVVRHWKIQLTNTLFGAAGRQPAKGDAFGRFDIFSTSFDEATDDGRNLHVLFQLSDKPFDILQQDMLRALPSVEHPGISYTKVLRRVWQLSIFRCDVSAA